MDRSQRPNSSYSVLLLCHYDCYVRSVDYGERFIVVRVGDVSVTISVKVNGDLRDGSICFT